MSLMNGLSTLGSGVAAFAGTAGLEAQKAELANQSAILADQLATTRGTTLQAQQGTITGGLQGQAQAAEAARQSTGIAATAAENEKQRQEAVALETMRENAPPEIIKTLRGLGVPLPGSPAAAPSGSAVPPAASALPGPRASQVATSDISASATPTANAPSPATPTGSSADLLSNPLVAKTLGLPMPGSEDAIRRGIAADVAADPQFKYKSAGAQGAEVENRLAIAQAKIGSPEDLDAQAKAIAGYKLTPLQERAAMMAGGPSIVSAVLRYNPDYNATNYEAVKETQKAIAAGGSLSTPISAMNTSMGHAAHFLDVAQQLGNSAGGNWANIIPNTLAGNTGNAPLVKALDQTAFAMAEEGNKIYAGNAGTETAIDHWYKSFPVNGSLADQVAAVKNFAQLMGDKFDTMTYQVNQTLSKAGLPPAELLFPKAAATYQKLTGEAPAAATVYQKGVAPTDRQTPAQAAPASGNTAPNGFPPLPSGFRVIQ